VSRRTKLLVGSGVIAAVLGGLVFSGLQQSVVYFVTPSELLAADGQAAGKAYRLGGMVVTGSLRHDPATRDHRFALSDGKGTVAVQFTGIPPDLFSEGRGAVVEGTLLSDRTFRATSIMAKHSEEYRAPHDAQPGYQELLKTLRPQAASGPAGPAPPAPRP
jgi:cytochrome c-type biogenesis protein CcmE